MLGLREEGRSFAAIARTLGLKRATDAHRALLRVVKDQPAGEREAVVSRELLRLDALEARIRTRDAEEPEKLASRMEGVEKMRTLLRATAD